MDYFGIGVIIIITAGTAWVSVILGKDKSKKQSSEQARLNGTRGGRFGGNSSVRSTEPCLYPARSST